MKLSDAMVLCVLFSSLIIGIFDDFLIKMKTKTCDADGKETKFLLLIDEIFLMTECCITPNELQRLLGATSAVYHINLEDSICFVITDEDMYASSDGWLKTDVSTFQQTTKSSVFNYITWFSFLN